jgi:hypothetical protein
LESSQLTNFIRRKSSSFLTLEVGLIHYLSALALLKLGRDVDGFKEARIATDILRKLGEKDLVRECRAIHAFDSRYSLKGFK